MPDQLLRAAVARWMKTAMASSNRPNGAKWTQEALADEAGVSRQTVNAILAGRTNAKPKTLAAIAHALRAQAPKFETSVRVVASSPLLAEAIQAQSDQQAAEPELGAEGWTYSVFRHEGRSIAKAPFRDAVPAEEALAAMRRVYEAARAELRARDAGLAALRNRVVELEELQRRQQRGSPPAAGSG